MLLPSLNFRKITEFSWSYLDFRVAILITEGNG